MTVTKIQPKTLFQRALEGRVLYTHVVVAETQSLIFISGQLARDKSGDIVGPRDMRRKASRRKSAAGSRSRGSNARRSCENHDFRDRHRRIFSPCRRSPRLSWCGSTGQYDGRGPSTIASGPYGRDRGDCCQRSHLRARERF
jgi:hypothetical protein